MWKYEESFSKLRKQAVVLTIDMIATSVCTGRWSLLRMIFHVIFNEKLCRGGGKKTRLPLSSIVVGGPFE